MTKKYRILVTSVGSLAGQTVHDILEYPGFRRRDDVDLVGTNSLHHTSNNFRCDRCYLVHTTESAEFGPQMIEIIRKERPDLILCARDEDTVALALLMESNPDLSGRLPYGKPDTLRYALDKWESWQFCRRHDLPFAATFVLGRSGGVDELREFVDTHGFPLITKPIRGFASRGVFYVRDWADARKAAAFDEYMLQEYLGDPDHLEQYFKQMDELTPLFAHAPNVFHHSCHTVINPDGSYAPIFISRNIHKSGATVDFRKVANADLEQEAVRFVDALVSEGGYGPIDIQFRQDKRGNWKIQEFNMRTGGNTFPRFLMGQDELGLIFGAVLPALRFPVYNPGRETEAYITEKKLTNYVLDPAHLEELRINGFWQSATKARNQFP